MAGAVKHLFPSLTVKPFRGGFAFDGGPPNVNLIVASRRDDRAPVSKRGSRSPRSIIKVSTADGKWRDQWSSELVVSLRQLHLEDLVEDEQQEDTGVTINLSIQKHAGFGFSIDGKVSTSLTRKCRNCYSPYCREVIYVKPGCEAELDSLVQDTLRLATSVMDTCSEVCENSDSTIQYDSVKKDTASLDKRWSVLLKLKNPKSQPPK